MSDVNPIEIWKPVKGIERFYSISNFGRIRREMTGPHTRIGKILKGGISKEYLCAVLTFGSDKKRKHVRFHSLVADHFIGERPAGMQINHKNGIKIDNRAENLEYVTPSQNGLHSYHVLGNKPAMGSAHYRTRLTEKDVIEIRSRFVSGEKQREIGASFGITQSNVCTICKRGSWKHI